MGLRRLDKMGIVRRHNRARSGSALACWALVKAALMVWTRQSNEAIELGVMGGCGNTVEGPLLCKLFEDRCGELWTIIADDLLQNPMLSEYQLQGSDHHAAADVLSKFVDNEVHAVVVCYQQVLCALEVEQIWAKDFPWTLWDFMGSQGFHLLGWLVLLDVKVNLPLVLGTQEP